MKDLRKTALIAAVLMGMQPLWALFFEMSRQPLPGISQWAYRREFTIELVSLATLPTLFLLLYLTAITLPVSVKQRSLAAVMAVLQAIIVLLSIQTRWNRNVRNDWHDVAVASYVFRQIGLMDWLRMPQIGLLTMDVLTLLWQLGLLLFVVGLSIPKQTASCDDRTSPLGEHALRLAKFVAAFAVIFGIGERLNGVFLPSVHYYNVPFLATARHLLQWSSLPLITPAIVWVSLRRYQANAKQPPQPAPTVSAHSDDCASSPEA